ncbi:DNA-3-methyladenine glycosylase [Dromiciops gliroides]|uniref:DNA-3-methyladenine glycosylase n=1 Tax=Dromiciops gliroides TaxID=33562 RepID=UPI001CC737D7|nr:DNA-3-methyladenine glycosylase [Dromiciops gliroides]
MVQKKRYEETSSLHPFARVLRHDYKPSPIQAVLAPKTNGKYPSTGSLDGNTSSRGQGLGDVTPPLADAESDAAQRLVGRWRGKRRWGSWSRALVQVQIRIRLLLYLGLRVPWRRYLLLLLPGCWPTLGCLYCLLQHYHAPLACLDLGALLPSFHPSIFRKGIPAFKITQLSRTMLRKKRRLSESKASQSQPKFDSLGDHPLASPRSPAPEYSIYFTHQKSSGSRLGPEFFDQPAITLARAFLGQILVRRLPDGTEVRGRVVETEAYLGAEDEAAHSRGGRQTPRNKGMFMKPGTLYVYIIYGMYFCMNVSSQGEGACILLRSLEPVGGLETMRQLRNAHRKGAARALKDRELCNGPSKLCQALAIDKSFDQKDLAEEEAIWLEQGPERPGEHGVVAAARIGINYAGEWALKPLRFYIQGNPYVSVVDRKVEQQMQASG